MVSVPGSSVIRGGSADRVKPSFWAVVTSRAKLLEDERYAAWHRPEGSRTFGNT